MAIWAIVETNREKSIGPMLILWHAGCTSCNNRARMTQGDELLPIFEVRREPVKYSIADSKRSMKPVK